MGAPLSHRLTNLSIRSFLEAQKFLPVNSLNSAFMFLAGAIYRHQYLQGLGNCLQQIYQVNLLAIAAKVGN